MPALRPVLEGVWQASTPVRILGTHLSSTMTVLRVDGGLLLHSPIPAAAELVAEVQALGHVRHLYSPNTFHHLWLGEWADRLPSATVHAPAALAEKRPELRIDRVHGEGGVCAGVEELPIAGFRLDESALLHRPSGSLLVADLVHNIGRPDHPWTQLYSRSMGFYDRVALSRMLQWTAFSDKAAARRSVDHILAQDFDALMVCHGAPILSDAKATLREALDWLPAATSGVPARPHKPSFGACG